MDKKLKKRIQALRDKLQRRRQQLASAGRQPDDPAELERVKADIAQIETQLEELLNR